MGLDLGTDWDTDKKDHKGGNVDTQTTQATQETSGNDLFGAAEGRDRDPSASPALLIRPITSS